MIIIRLLSPNDDRYNIHYSLIFMFLTDRVSMPLRRIGTCFSYDHFYSSGAGPRNIFLKEKISL